MQLGDSARRHREVQTRRTPDSLRGRAEEGAGDAHVVVVGRADVHHQVGGRAQPVPAAEGVASPRRQRVGVSDDLFLTKNWAGWSKLLSNNSAAPDSGPELRLLGNQSARVFLERDGGAHQCELIMINDEALVQTKSLSTQLSLTTNQRNPGCLVIAGNTGNVVCNTSFTDLSDSRVKTEIAKADVAELLQLFDSGGQAVQAPGHERGPEAGLRLGRLAGTKWKNLTGTTRWSDGTEILTSPACCGGCARASRPGWTHLKPGRPSGGQRTSRCKQASLQWSDHFERAAGAYNARPHETVHGAPEDVERQPATEFRVLQDNADKFQHNKDLTDRLAQAPFWGNK